MSNCNCGTSQPPGTARIISPSKFGRCRFCIYGSLLLALAGWGAYVPVMFDPHLEIVAWGTLAIAFPATLLFGIHMGVIIAERVVRS